MVNTLYIVDVTTRSGKFIQSSLPLADKRAADYNRERWSLAGYRAVIRTVVLELVK